MQAIQRASAVFDVLPKEEWLTILAEIGLDEIATPTSFVSYMCERYGESKSSVWYRLRRLKELGLLDFAEKGEEPRPLALTERGQRLLRNTVVRSASRISLQTV